jgi:hypothetical protein
MFVVVSTTTWTAGLRACVTSLANDLAQRRALFAFSVIASTQDRKNSIGVHRFPRVDFDVCLTTIQTPAEKTNRLSGPLAETDDLIHAGEAFTGADLRTRRLRRRERSSDGTLRPTQLQRTRIGPRDDLDSVLHATGGADRNRIPRTRTGPAALLGSSGLHARIGNVRQTRCLDLTLDAAKQPVGAVDASEIQWLSRGSAPRTLGCRPPDTTIAQPAREAPALTSTECDGGESDPDDAIPTSHRLPRLPHPTAVQVPDDHTTTLESLRSIVVNLAASCMQRPPPCFPFAPFRVQTRRQRVDPHHPHHRHPRATALALGLR